MSFQRDIRAWAAGVLADLDGAGRVLPYVPVLATWADFRAAFDTGERDGQGATVWRGWTVQVTGATVEGSGCKGQRRYSVEYAYYRTPTLGDEELDEGEAPLKGRSERDVWDHIIAAANALTNAAPSIEGLFKLGAVDIPPRVDYRAWEANISHVATLTQAIHERL